MSCGGMARKGRRGTGEQFLGEELWMKSMEHIKKAAWRGIALQRFFNWGEAPKMCQQEQASGRKQ